MSDKIVIDFHTNALDFDGAPLKIYGNDTETHTWGKFLRISILQPAFKQEKLDTFKIFQWSGLLADNKPLEIDRADFDALRLMVDNAQVGMIVRGNLLAIMDTSRDKKVE